MLRLALLAALWSTAPAAQETAAAGLAAESGAVRDAADPVAAWEADPTAPLDATGLELADFAYLARPLVVFADSPRDPQLQEQLRLLGADAAGLAGRDVAVIVDADPGARSAVRQALRPRGFGLVLVDKDGRVALRRPSPQTAREVSRAIDRSPIRIEELRQGETRGAEAG